MKPTLKQKQPYRLKTLTIRVYEILISLKTPSITFYENLSFMPINFMHSNKKDSRIIIAY
jgi:hypothetical protein